MKPKLDKKRKFNLTYGLIALGLFLLIQSFLADFQATERIPYSRFLSLVESGGIEDVVVKESTVEGTLKEPINDHDRFITTRVTQPFTKSSHWLVYC